jgi:hypothetical protein
MSDIERPECFEFGMEFMGDPEETVIRQYVADLENRLQQVTKERDEAIELLNEIIAERFLKGSRGRRAMEEKVEAFLNKLESK